MLSCFVVLNCGAELWCRIIYYCKNYDSHHYSHYCMLLLWLLSLWLRWWWWLLCFMPIIIILTAILHCVADLWCRIMGQEKWRAEFWCWTVMQPVMGNLSCEPPSGSVHCYGWNTGHSDLMPSPWLLGLASLKLWQPQCGSTCDLIWPELNWTVHILMSFMHILLDYLMP